MHNLHLWPPWLAPSQQLSLAQLLYFNYVNDVPKFLLTHPITSHRIAESKNRSDQYPHREIKSTNAFSLIRMRTLVITANRSSNIIKYLQTKLTTTQQDPETLQYGYALALY